MFSMEILIDYLHGRPFLTNDRTNDLSSSLKNCHCMTLQDSSRSRPSDVVSPKTRSAVDPFILSFSIGLQLDLLFLNQSIFDERPALDLGVMWITSLISLILRGFRSKDEGSSSEVLTSVDSRSSCLLSSLTGSLLLDSSLADVLTALDDAVVWLSKEPLTSSLKRAFLSKVTMTANWDWQNEDRRDLGNWQEQDDTEGTAWRNAIIMSMHVDNSLGIMIFKWRLDCICLQDFVMLVVDWDSLSSRPMSCSSEEAWLMIAEYLKRRLDLKWAVFLQSPVRLESR